MLKNIHSASQSDIFKLSEGESDEEDNQDDVQPDKPFSAEMECDASEEENKYNENDDEDGATEDEESVFPMQYQSNSDDHSEEMLSDTGGVSFAHFCYGVYPSRHDMHYKQRIKHDLSRMMIW